METKGTATLSASSDAYENNKQYIARITGRDAKYTYQREFIGRKSGRRSEVTEAVVDDAGLYEVCGIDKKGGKNPLFRIVMPDAAGALQILRSGADNADGMDGDDAAMAIAKRLGQGETIDQIIEVVTDATGSGKYRIRTKAQAEKAAKASTIQSVTDECWALLSAMGEKEAKAVLAALKVRVSPPKPKSVAAVTSEMEVAQ